jgi:hypothetical protein
VTARAVLLAGFFALAPLNQAWSWGPSGHSIIAEIAQHRLHPAVFAQIENLLGGQTSLASIATWADEMAKQRPETLRWHFVDIPYEATNYDPKRDCNPTPKGDCIINAIERFLATLKDQSQPKRKRAEALMFLVHFVGDLHQPLHVIERNGDAGGNRVAVTFFDAPMSLHMVWDIGIIDRRAHDWGEYVRILERDWLPNKDIRTLQSGNPVEWALAAHAAAVNITYVLPADLKLGDSYYQQSLPIVDRQLALAGIRLAHLLNATFGHPGYFAARPSRKVTVNHRAPHHCLRRPVRRNHSAALNSLFAASIK